MKKAPRKFKTNKVKKQVQPEESSSSSSDESDGYENSDGEYTEKEKFYRAGGYHPAKVGDKYGNYTICKKLGFGHFSTVWLVEKEDEMKDEDLNLSLSQLGDISLQTEKYALKIVKSAKTYTEMAMDEIKLLTRISENDKERKMNVLHIIDNFTIEGPNGKHICMVTDLGGSNLLDLIKFYDYKGIPEPVTKLISYQVLKALNYIHTSCEIIHTDLKPENVLLNFVIPKGTTPETFQIPAVIKSKLVDFGNANWVHKRFTNDIQTLEYRCPEVILGLHWGTPADIWSHACMIFELLTGDYLFKPKSGKSYSTEEDHLAQFQELLGVFPHKYLKQSSDRIKKYFNSNFELKHIPNRNLKIWKTQSVLMEKYGWEEQPASVITELLEGMLIYDENRRWSAKQCMKHKWFEGIVDE